MLQIKASNFAGYGNVQFEYNRGPLMNARLIYLMDAGQEKIATMVTPHQKV